MSDKQKVALITMALLLLALALAPGVAGAVQQALDGGGSGGG